MQDTVKVFIASSIVEFADLRDEIENFLWKFRDGRQLDVMPVRCENADPSMSVVRKEDDYCRLIAESAVCLFLFEKNVGAYSLEEYEYAKRLISEGADMRVLMFFRGDALRDFMLSAEADGFAVYKFCAAGEVCAALSSQLEELTPPALPAASEAPVNIFLASSIKDDERQRLKIENFIWRMNAEFLKAYSLAVRPLIPGTGNDPDEIITKSRMCFFIVFTRVEDEAKKELAFAKKYFDATGYPKIYVYFNTLPQDKSEEQSVADFKTYLDRELKHFYGTFSGVDTIKLRILLNLAIQETGSEEVTFKDGKCYFGCDEMFSVENVSEFVNNKKLAELKGKFAALSNDYHLSRLEYEKDRSDRAACERYYDIAARYVQLSKKIEELEENIFSVTLSMSRDEVHGVITEKQRLAYRYFEAGEVEKAVAILDVDESLQGYRRAENLVRERAEEVISEGRLKIDFLRTMYQYKERYEIMGQTYEKLLPVASASQVQLDIYNDYAMFLAERDRHKEALEKALMLKTLYTVFPAAGGLAERADNLTVLATVCGAMSDMQKQAVEYSLGAVSLRSQIYGSDKSNAANNAGMAGSYFVLGDIYRRAQRLDEAREYFEKAAALYEELSKSDPSYAPDLAKSLINRGITFFERYMVREALACYGDTAEMLQKYPMQDPRLKYQLSSCYQNSAASYRKTGEDDRAVEMFSRALEIRKQLADDDPAGYMPALAYSYQGLGNAYRSKKQWQQAVDNFIQAYNLRKVICGRNPAHENQLADSCCKLAGVLLDMKRPEDALPYAEECLSIRSRLYSVSPQTYLKWYAQILFEFGRYHEQKKDIARAEEYYDRALELRTSGEVQIAPNAEALYDSFTKMRSLYGEDFKQRLSAKAAEVYRRLLTYNEGRPECEHIRPFTSYTD